MLTNKYISIDSLCFGYTPSQMILNNISFEIIKGSYMALLGASGSGKSTLLRIIANILPNNKAQYFNGEVSVFGESAIDYRDTGYLSFMFQEPSLMPNLNVRDNIEFPLRLRGESVDIDFVDSLISTVGLKEHQNKLPKQLSGGMKTRVSLARAFVTKPELLLLDEPFSALDISWRYEMYTYLDKIKEKLSTTVILVTHDIQEAVLLADKILVLSKEGRIINEKKLKQQLNRHFDYEYTNKILKNKQPTLSELQTDILLDGKKQLDDKESKIILPKHEKEITINEK
jgi:NitT/TauT family transport system ATP-binding protein